MGVVSTTQPCTICLRREPIMHSHHTVPRARGGDDSLQIILCPTDHNSLHAAAVNMISRIRRPSLKRKAKRFWRSPEDEERAKPYLEILVRALLSPIPEGVTRQHILSTSVETPVFEDFLMLQADLGLPSQEETLLYCIAQTLKLRGIDNVERKEHATATPWFLSNGR